MPIVFTETYKEKIFWFWYNHNEPSPERVQKMIPPIDDVTGTTPSLGTLRIWVAEWKERAKEINDRTRQEITAKTVQEKVKLIEKHAKVGGELLDIGLEYIRNHKNDLTDNIALRAITQGYEMERASIGVAQALQKMLSADDQKLLDEITSLIEETSVLEDIKKLTDDE